MTNEDMLQNVITNLIERMGRQTVSYETEIANLNAQVALHQARVEQVNVELQKMEKRTAKKDRIEEDDE
jgi:acyl-CoA thioesterase FadM